MSTSDSFWSAQSAWWSARPAAQRKAERLKISDKPGMRTFAYLNDGSQWMQKPGEQRGLVRIDPKLRKDMFQLISDLAPMLVESYDRNLGGLAFKAWREWPVATGLSKSMIELRYDTEDDATKIRGRVVSRAPYTGYIHGNPFRTLIDSQGLTVATAIAREVGKEFQRHE